MTRRRTNLWAGVVLAAIGAVFCLVLFVVIPDDEPQLRMALLGLVVLAGQGAVVRFLTGHISRETRRSRGTVSRETRRGRDVSRETSGDVSRETSRRPKGDRR
jgi:hypothetical protein